MTDLDEILTALSRARLSLNNERETQEQIRQVLLDQGADFSREHRLDGCSRPDFYLNAYKTAIEVKLSGSRTQVYAQCMRYLAHPDVEALVLITNRTMNLPNVPKGKRAAVISLGKAWI